MRMRTAVTSKQLLRGSGVLAALVVAVLLGSTSGPTKLRAQADEADPGGGGDTTKTCTYTCRPNGSGGENCANLCTTGRNGTGNCENQNGCH